MAGPRITAKERPERILIFPEAKVGDIICTTPVFKSILSHIPNATITLFEDSAIVKDVLKDSGLIHGYLSFRGATGEVISRVKKEKFDCGLLIMPSFRVLAIMYLSGIPTIVAPEIVNGISPTETRLYKRLKKFVTVVPYEMGKYAPRERLRVLEPLGIHETNTTKILAYSKEAEEAVRVFMVEHEIKHGEDFIVGISPATGSKIKQWPPERFAELAEYLYKKYSAKIIIIGAKNDKTEIEEVMANLSQGTKVINAYNKLNLDETKALISKLNLFIAADTGPIYIAEAFNVPTIDIVGPVDEREQPPIGRFHKVVVTKRDKAEIHIMNSRMYDEKETRRQTEDISVAQVIAVFEELRGDLNGEIKGK
ncbi:MAG: glycosyltransferase family 9 protein [bacterium]|nr:glycosyltransferase family 9 protein [bacterium]